MYTNEKEDEFAKTGKRRKVNTFKLERKQRYYV